MEKYFLLLSFLIIPGIIIYIYREKNKANHEQPKEVIKFDYFKKKFFFTPTEKDFYFVLKDILKDTNYKIFPKVRLEEIITVHEYAKKQKTLRNYIKSLSVDFLICNDEFFNPLLIIELDDKSHERKDRKDRDQKVDKALNSAQLKILHIPASFKYYREEIGGKIFRELEEIIQ